MVHASLIAYKNGLTITGRRSSLTKILYYQRPTMIARRIASAKASTGRLIGGSDAPIEPEFEEKSVKIPPEPILEIPSPPPPPPPPLPSILPTPSSSSAKETPQPEIKANDLDNKQLFTRGGPCCSCLSQSLESIGDKKVDELIAYIHQNLEEAGKALATLGENFEHDLKLIFVDMLGRIKQWTGIVQNKLNVCKNDVNSLRKELLARLCEIDAKTREMTDLKIQIADYQNGMKFHESVMPEAIMREKQVMDHIPLTKDARAIALKKIKEEDKTQDMDGKYIEDHEVDRGRRDGEKKRTDVYASSEAQTVGQEREQMRRESELESEIMQLRKENDRILKERAEYENAIQRALLRGVSSLNVEALKVLRCPPIPCCSPCVPCPTTAATIPPEPVVPCPAKSTKKRPGTAVCGIKLPRDKNAKNNDAIYCATKRPCASACCASRSRQKHDNMLLLLRQGDTGNLCASDEDTALACRSHVVRKMEIPLPKLGE